MQLLQDPIARIQNIIGPLQNKRGLEGSKCKFQKHFHACIWRRFLHSLFFFILQHAAFDNQNITNKHQGLINKSKHKTPIISNMMKGKCELPPNKRKRTTRKSKRNLVTRLSAKSGLKTQTSIASCDPATNFAAYRQTRKNNNLNTTQAPVKLSITIFVISPSIPTI